MSEGKKLKLTLRFVTCTTMEAIEELNLQIKDTRIPEITEDDLVDTIETEHEKDWFDDYLFIFEKNITGNIKELEKALRDNFCDFDLEEI